MIKKYLSQLKFDNSITLGAIIQAVLLLIGIIIISNALEKSNEQNLLIAQRVVSTLDDLDIYLESIEDSNDNMESTLVEIEGHLDEINETIGEKGYSEDSIVKSVNKIRREID